MAYKKVLIVEDDPRFIAAARRFAGNEHVYAADYLEAHAALPHVDAALLDCFLPPGRDNDGLSGNVVEKMINLDPREMSARATLRMISRFADIEELGIFARYLAEIQELRPERETRRELRKLREIFGSYGDRKTATIMARQYLEQKYGRDPKVTDPYARMQEKITDSPKNQPLGLELAEMAYRIGRPFLLHLSSSEPNQLTGPVYTYMERKGWAYIDMLLGGRKDTLGFWSRAFDMLEGKASPWAPPESV